jgi:hypothetical protein
MAKTATAAFPLDCGDLLAALGFSGASQRCLHATITPITRKTPKTVMMLTVIEFMVRFYKNVEPNRIF